LYCLGSNRQEFRKRNSELRADLGRKILRLKAGSYTKASNAALNHCSTQKAKRAAQTPPLFCQRPMTNDRRP
jgi:hypothetical protein